MEVLQRTANRGSVSTGPYQIDNSIKFEADNSEQLYRTPSSDGNMKTWTYSIWFKRTELGASQTLIAALDTYMYFETNDTAWLNLRSASTNFFMATNRMFRDTSAWYHAVIACDTTDSTAADRLKLYINGVRETSFSNDTYENIDGNDDTGMNKATVHRIGQYSNYGSKFSGYMAEANLIDGQALAPTEFGEFDSDTGIWIPKEYTGSYGTNGFYLDFADASDLGDDESGNGNDWTEGAITAADQSTDTPTNNFCTLNPNVNFKYGTNAGGMINGATTFGDDTGGGVGGAFGTFAVTAGKWYWEVKLTQQNAHYIGVSAVDDGDNVLVTSDPHQVNSTFRFNISAARIEYFNGGSNTNGSNDSFSDFHTVGDIIGIALNMDDNQISIYGNGTLQSGVANTSLFDAANKMVVPFHGTINDECQYNFGGYSAWTPSSAVNDANGYGTFEYAPPSGYYAICTKNLAEYG
jgi:hypothetical protein